MNALVNFTQSISMTSKEIADLVGKRHDNTKRTIETLCQSGVISKPQIEDGIKSANGVVEKVYIFSGEQGKRDSIIVVAQLCPEVTARLVDRWQELEAQLASNSLQLPNFTDPYEAAIAWAQQYKENKASQAEVGRLQLVCNNLAAQLQEGLTPPKFCQMLNGVNSQQVNGYLHEKGFLIKTGEDLGYHSRSQYRDQLFIDSHVKEGKRIYNHVLLTTKGAKRLYKMYIDGKLPMKKTWDGKFTHDKVLGLPA